MTTAPSEQFEREEDIRELELAALRFVQGASHLYRPVRLRPLPTEASGHAQALLAGLQVARKFIQVQHPAAIEAYRRLWEAERQLASGALARLLVRFGVKIDPAAFHLKGSTVADVEQILVQTNSRRQLAATDVRRFEEAVGARLSSALHLLRIPEIAGRIEGAEELTDEASRLAECLRRLGESMDEIVALRQRAKEVRSLLSNFGGRKQDEAYVTQTEQSLTQLRRGMDDLRRELSDCAYPFGHGQANVTIGAYLIKFVPDGEDVGALMAASVEMVERGLKLHRRVFGRLAQIAEIVETAAGFPLMPNAVKKPVGVGSE